MITSKPVIRLADLLAFLNYPESRISYPVGYLGAKWFRGGALGIAAMCECVIAKKNRKITIAVPSYFCGQTLRFLRSISVNIVFYELSEELTPDFQKIEKQFLNVEVDIFVLVHYFGSIKAQREARIFADCKDAVMLEDAAHVYSYKHHEWLGDYLLFSPHKHFASPEIGLLIFKKPEPFYEKEDSISPIFPFKWLLKQVFRAMFVKSTSSWGVVWCDDARNIDRKSPDRYSVKQAIFNLQNPDDAIKTRKNNAAILLKKLSYVGGWRQFNNFSTLDTPYLLPMICDDANIAKQRYEKLNVHCPLVMQWPDLPGELKTVHFDTSLVAAWLDRVLFFFIHQQMDEENWLGQVKQIITAKGF